MFIFHDHLLLGAPPPRLGEGSDERVTKLEEAHLPVFAEEQCWRRLSKAFHFSSQVSMHSWEEVPQGMSDVNIARPSLSYICDTKQKP